MTALSAGLVIRRRPNLKSDYTECIVGGRISLSQYQRVDVSSVGRTGRAVQMGINQYRPEPLPLRYYMLYVAFEFPVGTCARQ